MIQTDISNNPWARKVACAAIAFGAVAEILIILVLLDFLFRAPSLSGLLEMFKFTLLGVAFNLTGRFLIDSLYSSKL